MHYTELMKYDFDSPMGQAALTIYPESSDRSLRPWDAADEYLLDEMRNHPDARRILVLNDAFGALGALLGDRSPWSVNDSFTARECIRRNISANGGTIPGFLSSCASLDQEADLVVLKIPKTLSLFRYQLEQISRSLPAGTPVLAGGLSRYLPKSFFEAFEEHAEGAAYSLIRKKARIYTGRLKPSEEDLSREESFTHDGLTYRILPGVFAAGKVDPGTRFLLEHFPRAEEPAVIVDPGCGYGILGMTAARKWTDARIIATDDSASAVESTRLSAEANGFGDRIDARHTDILQGVEDGCADLVICNPPFHQQQRISVETGFRFIDESARVLKPGGQLFLVANRHLGYQKQLESRFAGTMIIAQSSKFVIYMCRK